MDDSEKEGGNTRESRQLSAFCEMLNCRTWVLSGLHLPGETRDIMVLIKERIERGLALMDWLTRFPKTQFINEVVVASDHSPLVIDSGLLKLLGKGNFDLKIYGVLLRTVVEW